MAKSTPENAVKAQVKKVLEEFKSKIDGYWPVPYGLGESHLDYIGCVSGRYFAIETKAPGKKPTPRQNARIASVERAGGKVFVIDGTDATETYNSLRKWLQVVIAREEWENL